MKYCLQCGKNTNNPKFCSRSCAASKNNKVPKRQLQNLCKKCEKPCLSSRTYCSKQCTYSYRDWDSMTLHEVRGIANYQKNSRVRDLARSIYRKSGKPKHCFVCGYSKHYEVCHIHGISTYELSTPLSVINSIENLIALCPNHHWELDNHLLTL